METWANLNVLIRESAAVAYVSPEEYQRRERVAVGKMCKCGQCLCCAEAELDLENLKKMRMKG